MLVINYNGNKPTTDYYKYSVQGNNNADVVRFCLSKQQGNLDLSASGYKVYVQARCEDDGFIDKVEISSNVSIVDNQLNADWVLLKKHTINRQLEVSLSFENASQEVVWQTQLVKIAIANGIDADEEIANTYPSVIQKMREDIQGLEEKDNDLQEQIDQTKKKFVEFVGDQYDALHLNSDLKYHFMKSVKILISGHKSKMWKKTRLSPKEIWGSKKGNIIDKETSIYEAFTTFYPKTYFETINNITLTRTTLSVLDVIPFFPKIRNGGGSSTPPPQTKIYHAELGAGNFNPQDMKPAILGRCFDRVFTNHQRQCARFMIKFASNYEEHEHGGQGGGNYTYSWSGTISKKWVEVQVSVIYNEDDDVYDLYVRFLPRRF